MPGFELQRELMKQAMIADMKKLHKYRQRFGSHSWFMSRLNEHLAKTSNAEDKVYKEVRDCALVNYVSSRFWDSFFASVKGPLCRVFVVIINR